MPKVTGRPTARAVTRKMYVNYPWTDREYDCCSPARMGF
jgi:hypothetical protein